MAVTNECCNSTARPGYPYPFANWSPAAQPYLPRRLMLVTTGCRLYRRDRQHRAYMGRISGERPGPTGICAARPAERPHRAAPLRLRLPPQIALRHGPRSAPFPALSACPPCPSRDGPRRASSSGLSRRDFLVGTSSSGPPRRAVPGDPVPDLPCCRSRLVAPGPVAPGPVLTRLTTAGAERRPLTGASRRQS